MLEKAYNLEIVTSGKTIYQGEAVSFTAPGSLGSFQVLYNHAPMVSTIVFGEVDIVAKDGKKNRYATSGGFVKVKNNKVIMLAETIEAADAIDIDRAKSAQERAIGRLNRKTPEINVERAKASLSRALNRLRVAGKL